MVDEHSTRRPPLVGSATACVSGVQGRRHLRTAALGLLHTPRYYLSTYGRRTFSYAGPSDWNFLPEHLRASDLSLNSFRLHSFKTLSFTHMTHAARWRLFNDSGLYKFTFYILHFYTSYNMSWLRLRPGPSSLYQM